MTEEPGRFTLLGILGGLMVAETMGDVHEEINHLHDLIGIPRPEGNLLHGWTPESWENIGHKGDSEDD